MPWRVLLPLTVLLLSLSLAAAPGAHGPDGEHLDTESAHQHAQLPRFESFTEQFELVGNLAADALLLDIHTYPNNRPVEGAKVELETGELSATALFDANSGQYRLTEPAMLATLQQHQRHELVITVIAGDAADLLLATLDTTHAEDITGHDDMHHHRDVSLLWLLLTAVVAFTLGIMLARRRGRAV